MIRMIPRVGDFVPTGGSLFAVYGDGEVAPDDVVRCIAVGKERTLHQDVAYGIRMLVDVAVRALAPASGTRRPPFRRSIGSMTACGCSSRVTSRAGSISTARVGSG